MGTMRQMLAILSFDTNGPGLYEIGEDVNRWIRETGIHMGLLTLFCRHTSASLLITENASSAVRRDLLRWLEAAAPEGAGYEHSDEGADDMPAHIKAMLTGTSLTVPVADGKMMLGAWQGMFLAEHRSAPHTRSVVAHLSGD
jgi:secondary thiamine-phosphate synthase enzyme